jgi:hypothetical protein
MHMATPPSRVSDARVPCPLCGGLIHPVAGRCKHCKQDLTSFRIGRPQAAAQLPSLLGGINGHATPSTPAPMAVTPTPTFGGGADGAANFAGDRPDAGFTGAREHAQQILPARPTGGAMHAPRPSAWRHWPIVVMSLAVVAIVIALAVLFWPPGSTSHADKLPPPPAPERMQTDPLPTQPQQAPAPTSPTAPTDPWAATTPHAQRSPGASDDDPSCVLEVHARACRRAMGWCGTRSDEVQQLCEDAEIDRDPRRPRSATMERCFDRIDAIDCGLLSSATSFEITLRENPECRDAMKHC